MTTNLVIKTDTKTNISFKLDPITHILNISTLKSKAFVQIIPELSVVVKGNSVTLIKNEGLVTCGNRKNLSQIFKTTATLIKNHIRGLSQPFKVYLQLNGLGFKAKIVDDNLILKLGYSHDVIFKIPKDINIKIPKATIIVGSGPDWNKLTQFASDIKATKKVEPYKGKGIFLKGEWILRKDGKKAKN